MRASVAAVYDRRNTKLPVISNRERGANVQGTLCGCHFLWRFWLFRKMNGSLIAVIR
jgi:hypothetical protein